HTRSYGDWSSDVCSSDLNVRNQGTIAGLPGDAVVEVPTLVDSSGVHPLSTEQPDLHQIGLMAQVKAVERHTISAALTGSVDEAEIGRASCRERVAVWGRG